MQSELDRERAKTASLEGRLGEIESKLGAFDPAKVADEFTARFNQQQAIAAARTQARVDYPLARADVFDGSFQTPEELVAAAQSSHEAESQYRDSVRSDVEKDVLARIKEQHGLSLDPAPQTPPAEGEGGGKPPLTQKDLAEMPMSEFLALDADVLKAVPTT